MHAQPFYDIGHFFGGEIFLAVEILANSDFPIVTCKFTGTVITLDEPTTIVNKSGSRLCFTAQHFAHCQCFDHGNRSITKHYQSMYHAKYNFRITTLMIFDCMTDNSCVCACRQHFQKMVNLQRIRLIVYPDDQHSYLPTRQMSI